MPLTHPSALPTPVALTAPRLRSALAEVPVYRPGRPAPMGRDGTPAHKLSANENPYPPLPSVLEVVREEAGRFNRYPDMFATELVEAIAARFDVPAGHVATGTGSVGVLQQIVQATAAEGDEVVYAWRSFEAYPIIVAISGASGVQVPLDAGEGHDLEAMAEAVTDRTRLVLLCTPNNPTGAALERTRLGAFLDQIPSDVLVVIDEAYREFVRGPGVPDGLDLYRTRPNVAVLRTFSKAYGLAGLRVGYAIAHDEVATALRKTAMPFGVSGVAQAAAVASLAAEAQLLERVDALVAERDRVQGALRAQGWSRLPDSQANFVWLRTGGRTAELAAACESAGVVVRPFGAEGARVTVAEPAANDIFLAVAAGFAT